MDSRPVGVFDSGVGGLTVLHECLVTLPHEDFVYLGDHARLPYGPRALDEVRRFAREIGSFLEAQDVKAIVVACNTATSAARPQQDEGVDTVILGCTHYPLIRPMFQRVFGRGVTLVFSAEETAREVAVTLARKGIENDGARLGSYRFLTTGDPAAFREIGRR